MRQRSPAKSIDVKPHNAAYLANADRCLREERPGTPVSGDDNPVRSERCFKEVRVLDHRVGDPTAARTPFEAIPQSRILRYDAPEDLAPRFH